MAGQELALPNRTYRVTIKGPQSQIFVMAKSAKEACEHAAKATHGGQEAVVEDETGNAVSEAELAELVRQGL